MASNLNYNSPTEDASQIYQIFDSCYNKIASNSSPKEGNYSSLLDKLVSTSSRWSNGRSVGNAFLHRPAASSPSSDLYSSGEPLSPALSKKWLGYLNCQRQPFRTHPPAYSGDG